MRAELPAAAATAGYPAATVAAKGGGRLSAAGARTLIEGLARVGDVLAVALAGALVASWRFDAGGMPPSAFTALCVGSLLAAHVLPWFCDYAGPRLLGLGWQIPRLLAGWAVTVGLVIAFLYATKSGGEVSRLWVGAWFLAGCAGLVAGRLALRLALGEALVARALTRRLAVVGLGEQLHRILRRLATAEPDARLAAALDLDGSLRGRWPRGVLPLRGFAELEERALAGRLDQVVVAVPARGAGNADLLERTLRNLRHLGVDVVWVPELPAGRVPVLGVARLGEVPVVRLLERPLDGWHWVLKAAVDRALAALLLLLLAPLLLLVALAVRLDSPGPVLYRQRRLGFSQQPIAMLKFRTMHADRCDPVDAPSVRQATRDDPRVTRVGRLLRRTSLDELPQLLNVLRGDMSLVGPRPHAVAHDRLYAEQIDGYLARHRVKPGITGWAQVNGYRGETRTVADMRRRIELDLEYIDNWSPWLDLRILVRTALVGFAHARAY